MGGGISWSPMRDKTPKSVPDQERRKLGIAIICASVLVVGVWFWSARGSGVNAGIGLVNSLQEEKVRAEHMKSLYTRLQNWLEQQQTWGWALN